MGWTCPAITVCPQPQEYQWVYGYGQTARGAKRNTSLKWASTPLCVMFRVAGGFAKPNVIAVYADDLRQRVAMLL